MIKISQLILVMERILKSKKRSELFTVKKDELENVCERIFGTIYLKKKKFNSIIINYDESSTNLFNWYQQLIAESLGKKGNGILPIISNMPKDNHSVMQLYLDGFKNNFFTFFYCKEKSSTKLNPELLVIIFFK